MTPASVDTSAQGIATRASQSLTRAVMLDGSDLFCERDDRILFEHLSFTVTEGQVLQIKGSNRPGTNYPSPAETPATPKSTTPLPRSPRVVQNQG